MIPLPAKPKITSEEGDRVVIEIEGLYPGYGQTIANGLRRVLLSSLSGAAVTSIKIDNVGHEFSTIEGVMEDVVDLMLNFKQMRFKVLEGEGPFTISVSANGEKEVNGRDFKAPSQLEIVTPNLHIATLTSKKSRLSIEATVETGLGYLPVESRSKEKVEVGTIALDAAFSPVRQVNYQVENMRVGDRTDYNRIRFNIETDGSIRPEDAFQKASQILLEQFKVLAQGGLAQQVAEEEDRTKPVGAKKKEEVESDPLSARVEDLKLSSRTTNALREAGIKTVGGLARKKENVLAKIDGLGEKGIHEIKKALGNLGIILKQ